MGLDFKKRTSGKNIKIFFLLAIISTTIFSSLWLLNRKGSLVDEKLCNMTYVSLGTSGFSTSCVAVVEKEAVYSLFLQYFYPEGDPQKNMAARSEMREALGTPEFKGPPGKKYLTPQTYPVTVRINIINSDKNQVIIDKNIAPEAVIKGRRDILAELFKDRLPLGSYQVIFSIVETNPDLEKINTKLKFSESYTGS